MTRHPQAFDRTTKRHTLAFGEFEARLADGDVAQLHDALVRLHPVPDPTVRRLRERLRRLVEKGDVSESGLVLDADAAQQVQLAVYADQVARKPVSPALIEARHQAFRYLESQPASPLGSKPSARPRE